jgi:steroid 5-alpha reductase family enzyme
MWSLLFVAAAIRYATVVNRPTPRAAIVLVLVALWALRLAVYITWRNWGEPEDRRYQQFRRNNDPGFAFKSVYIIFGLQALLAWIISLPLLAAIGGQRPLGILDGCGIVLWTIGLLCETIGDLQLARFKAHPQNRGAVMDRGLWRYTRHPNYFGECCVWWGLYLIALSAGGWWSIVSPVVMTFLLLKVSGVTLLEKDIGERRPQYREYVARTSAFIPWPPRTRG